MVPLKGLHKVQTKGRTYYYAWRGGPRIEAPFGSREFLTEFELAKNPLADADRRKLSTWVSLYKASAEFKALAPRTQAAWGPWLDRITDEFGGLSIKLFDRPTIRVDIRHWRDKWRKTPRTADYAKQVLSRVLSFAVAEGALGMNACHGIKNIYRANRAQIIWEAGDVERLCRHASPEIAHALRLACLTGLRQGDLLRLSWSHVGEKEIVIRTSKSRERLTARVPITAQLRALLATIPKRSTRVLTNTFGRPWGNGFGMSWNKAMQDSGLKEKGLHFHDARGTAATNFYVAGLTYREIAEILAWSEDQVRDMIDRYVKRDEVLSARIRRMESFTQG